MDDLKRKAAPKVKTAQIMAGTAELAGYILV